MFDDRNELRPVTAENVADALAFACAFRAGVSTTRMRIMSEIMAKRLVEH